MPSELAEPTVVTVVTVGFLADFRGRRQRYQVVGNELRTPWMIVDAQDSVRAVPCHPRQGQRALEWNGQYQHV